MHTLVRDSSPPRGLMLGIAGFLAAMLVLVAVARWSGLASRTNAADAAEAAAAGVAVEAALHFTDRDDGGVSIRLAADGREIAVLAPGTNGFVRGVMRGLARDRRLHGIDAAPPFLLARWHDGRLTLTDPATGRAIDLGAFGPTNREAFAGILAAASQP
jgi:putative photosynthetic complex assembly protein